METPPNTASPAPKVKKPSRINRHLFTSIVWYIYWVVAVVMGLRVLLLMLAANAETPFVAFIYNLNWYFIAPFLSMFSEPDYTKFYFDTNAVVGMIVYWLVALGVTKLININR